MSSHLPAEMRDAETWLERAQEHLVVVKKQHWKIRSSNDPFTHDWVYSIHLDRESLNKTKIQLAECATSLASALDQVVAGLAKANGKGRGSGGYYPFRLDQHEFSSALKRTEEKIGTKFANIIETHHLKHKLVWPHVQAMKKLSNAGKHWELKVPTASSKAIAVDIPKTGQRIFDIPSGTFDTQDSFEFHRSPEPLPTGPMTVVLTEEISGLPADLPTSPDTILTCASRYVKQLINAASDSIS